MKLPLSWLNEYVSIKDIEPKKLADTLLNIGFEVEEIIYVGKDINNVLTAKILEISKHPDADKLQVCKIDAGKTETVIVTGAHNIAVGDIIPVALDGANLPGEKYIVAAPLRGIMSFGMMCSGSELGIDNNVIDGAEVDGILILPSSTPVGKDIKDILRLNDIILDISVTANRPDCQSIYGMARELGAALSREVKPLNFKYDFSSDKDDKNHSIVTIKNYELCPSYSGTIIKDVKVERSPDWIRDRLLRVGIRPINNIVDITNYVLTEVGQPLHSFDLRFVKDSSIIVRNAEANEKIVALDGKEYALTASMLVIADSEKALAIAGVMGGQYSGILPDTSSVFLEAAKFAKGGIRTTSRMLGLRSDSSARYEKGVDWWCLKAGRERALSLICELKAGKISKDNCCDEAHHSASKTIKTSADQICDLLGIDISKKAIVNILQSLQFGVEEKDGKLKVNVPPFREDIDNYTDLAEEVIRFYGYDNIKSTLLKTASTTVGGLSQRQIRINELKNFVCGLGSYEITTYSFINNKINDKLCIPKNHTMRDVISVLNPLSEEYAVMRTQLAGNMLSTVYLNLNRKNKDFRLFEIGKTYIPKSLPLKELPSENETLCIAFVGKDENFYTIKAAVVEIMSKFLSKSYELDFSAKCYLHPGISADIFVKGYAPDGKKVIGSFGKVHPSVAKNFEINDDVFIAEIDLEGILTDDLPKIKFSPLPKFPAVDRDLAVIVKEETPVGKIVETVAEASELCSGIEIFDIYRGAQVEQGYKSVAFSFKLQSPIKTLTEEEIQQAVENILKDLEVKANAKLRF